MVLRAAVVLALVFRLVVETCFATNRTIGVFVALADNAGQGLVPVPAAIGNGGDPDRNLYWGTADGLKGVFDGSRDWRLTGKKDEAEGAHVLRTRTYTHRTAGAVLHAFAYKGTSIGHCIRDFESAVRAGTYDMAVFIGHNGLMDFDLPVPSRPDRQEKAPDCVVLCCKSERYFKARVESAGGRPVLLTTQFMYPGAFILHAAVDAWLGGGTLKTIRERAGAAYAANQKISVKAGVGVFADVEKQKP
jgi:hypothetical protein